MITVVHYAAGKAPPDFEGHAEIAVIDSAATPAALTRLRARISVDVIVAEVPAETGAEAWLAPAKGAVIVALVDSAAEDAALDALHAGASAVLPNGTAAAELADAIVAAARGYAVLPHTLLRDLIAADEPPAVEQAKAALLTARELEVLGALADGASNKMIARRLDISFHTVKFHVASILAKLDAETRTEAVAQAARLGLVML
jgi:two-component system, NarL family, nitrate/nitrite response regulator NarL